MNALTYVFHRARCISPYSIHSPYAYSFYSEVVRTERSFPEYKRIQAYWKYLRKNYDMLNLLDLGAGSKKKQAAQKPVRDLARSSSSDPAKANFLFRLSRFSEAKRILELGSHLGMGSLALKLGSPEAEMISMEGNPAFIDFIRKGDFSDQFSTIELIQGNFDETLDPLLEREQDFDLIYIDGNHTKEATIRYYNLILEKNSTDSIIVFDDIRWSKEMLAAWNEIRSSEESRLCFDFYFFGIIFTSNAFSKQCFRLPFP